MGSMSLSPSNQEVVLGSKSGLYVLHLDQLYTPPRFFAYSTPWEVADIQWNPHASRSKWVASTSNQKLVIWNLDRPARREIPKAPSSHLRSAMLDEVGRSYMTPVLQDIHTNAWHSAARSSMPTQSESSQAVERLLDAHSRAITDLNWSPMHPDVIASCSVDTWIRVWDLRMFSHGTRPAQSLCSWNASMTQVKWNRRTPHRIASSCDNKILIWDDRFGAVPLAAIEAHHSKVYGIDWSPAAHAGRDRLMTCSLDGTIKFWDLDSPSSREALVQQSRIIEPEFTIETPQPVWRARHLPSGHGALSISQRGDTGACMWAYGNTEPQRRFEGHTDQIKEFMVRSSSDSWQLITWSHDQTLRIWPMCSSELQTEQTPSLPLRTGSPDAFCESQSNTTDYDEGDVHSMSLSRSSLKKRAARTRRIRRAECASEAGDVETSHLHTSVHSLPDVCGPPDLDAVHWMAHVRVGGDVHDADDDDDNHSTSKPRDMDPSVLPQEILRVNAQYPNILESIDIAHRRCTIAVSGPWHQAGSGALAYLRVMFTFPLAYPLEPPALEMERNASIPFATRAALYRALVDLIEERAAEHALCLESCVAYLKHGREGKNDHPAPAPQAAPVLDSDAHAGDSFMHSYHAVSDAVLQLALRSTDLTDSSLGDLDIVRLMSTNILGQMHENTR